MDAAHVPGHPHPGMSSRCLPGPAWLAGPARPFPGPALAGLNRPGLNQRGHPGCGCRSRAPRMAGLPMDDRRSRRPRRGESLPASRSRARPVRDRRQPSRCHEGPHHEGPHHEGPHHEGPHHEGPHHEGPHHEARQTTARHPQSSHPTGRRPAAAPLALPHSAAGHSAVLLPVAAHFVAHRHGAQRHGRFRPPVARRPAIGRPGMRRPSSADRLFPHWPALDCPGPDRADARPCSRQCLGRPRAGHVRCPVPNPARGRAYLGGPLAGALGNRRPGDRRPGDRQTTRTTCLAGQDRPSPSPDAPLPRSSSKLASRPPCR